MTTTPMRIATNRQNALASTGPRSLEGKARSSRNATRHGLTATAIVLPHVETAADWQAHRDGVLASLAPVGHLEHELADRVAVLTWRLRRVVRHETAMLGAAQASAEADAVRPVLAGTNRDADLMSDEPLDDLRTDAKDAHALYELLDRVHGLGADAPLKTDDAADVVNALAEAAGLDVLEDEIPVPGVPDELMLEEWTAWTAGLVHGAAAAIAQGAATTADALWSRTRTRAAIASGTTRRQLRRATERLARLRGERLVMPGHTADNVARYEAHLQRMLAATLASLERTRALRPTAAAAAEQ